MGNQLSARLASIVSRKPCYFLDLPLEIRRLIYIYLVPDAIPYYGARWKESDIQFVRTCRQIYTEAMEVFYEFVTFEVQVMKPSYFICGYRHNRQLQDGSYDFSLPSSICAKLSRVRRFRIKIIVQGGMETFLPSPSRQPNFNLVATRYIPHASLCTLIDHLQHVSSRVSKLEISIHFRNFYVGHDNRDFIFRNARVVLHHFRRLRHVSKLDGPCLMGTTHSNDHVWDFQELDYEPEQEFREYIDRFKQEICGSDPVCREITQMHDLATRLREIKRLKAAKRGQEAVEEIKSLDREKEILRLTMSQLIESGALF